jgi:hypothetical protein
MWPKLWGGHKARQKWEVGLTWYRLRYLDAAGPTRCLHLLSRPEACGRVALYFRPGEAVSQLYLGVPALHGRLLQRMVADFGFSLKPAPANLCLPEPQPLTAVPDFPWERPFVGQVVGELAFVSLVEGENKQGAYLPQPPAGESGRGLATWGLPDNPLPGLSMQPSWNGQQPPAHLIAAAPQPRCWLLGRSREGLPVQVDGQVNLYGRQEAVADWLLSQVTQQITLDPASLVVIDGVGDLVPRLKRKAAVTRLLGQQLAYVDIDGTALADGFNPLAAVPGESETELVARWQTWFGGMNVHPQGSQLLAQARQAGVEDMPGLRQWLKQVERRGQPMAQLPVDRANGSGSAPARYPVQAISSLGMALNRLTAGRSLREWLEWPANRFDILPEGGLLFACKGNSWDRQQVLRAVLLAALQVKGVRLVLYGLPWQSVPLAHWERQAQVVVGNGPLMPHTTVVLTECHSHGLAALAGRFLAGDARLSENLALLGRGEGMVIANEEIFSTAWQTKGEAKAKGW